jgi:hypothetical protein
LVLTPLFLFLFIYEKLEGRYCNPKTKMQKFKNPALQQLVREVKQYGNLVLNDVPVDSENRPILKKENRVKDNKMNRAYYNATFISLENINKARTVTLWQSHTDNAGSGVVWKSLNPVVAVQYFGKPIEGKIAVVTFNEDYEVNGNFVNTATLFIPHEDQLEPEITRFAIQNGLIIEEDNNDIDNNLPEGNSAETKGETPIDGAEEEPVLVDGKTEEPKADKGKQAGKGKNEPPVTTVN